MSRPSGSLRIILLQIVDIDGTRIGIRLTLPVDWSIPYLALLTVLLLLLLKLSSYPFYFVVTL